ncbi:MAG: hypothetical protein ABL900_00220 [Burkholderiaceae bacterium]
MSTRLPAPRRIALMVLLSAVLAGCASGSIGSFPNLLRRIESGDTRSDHEELAGYYDRQAALARTIAAEHRRMSQSYEGVFAGGRGAASLPAHCKSIVDYQMGIAAAYEGLAADHRQIAARPMFKARHEQMRRRD